MYQSLYRTWRSKTFSDMVGQEHVIRTLRQQASSGHIAHAYLFSGSRGTGKTSAARILSMAINCRNPKDGDPCLQCEACRSLLSDTTLDVVEMDAASNSGVGETRDMLERVSYPPQFVRYKVYIIDEVHMLSNAAFNALLKTLEEPPAYMVFILATTELQKIPATILSRCQRFEFGRIPEADMIGRLRLAIKESGSAQEEALELIASSAEGSMRDAWSLMDMCLDEDGTLTEERVRQTLGTVTKGFMFDFVSALQAKQADKAFQMIEQLHSAGKDVQVFVKSLSSHLRQLIAARLAKKHSNPMVQEQSAQIPLEKLTWMLERAIRAEGDLRWTSQQRAVLEVYALSVCQMSSETEPLALQARLAELESMLSGGSMPSSSTQPAHKEQTAAAKSPVPAADLSVKTQATKPVTHEDGPWPSEPPEEQDYSPPPSAEQIAPSSPASLPAPAQAGHSAGTSVMTPKAVWNTALERARKELPNIYSIISEGKFGGYRDGCYYLNFSADKQFFISFMMAEDRRKQIEGILNDIGTAPARFEAVKEQDAVREQDAREKARQDIQALSEVFGRQNIIVTGMDGD